jgi:Leucine-rich repeat (LRR) protein
MRSGLINLQKIYLSKCRLSHINSRAFRGLSNLVDLDLGHNLLREVPTASFPDCQGLMRLILSGNPIPHIQKRAFVSLQALTTLELSQAGIEVIEHVSTSPFTSSYLLDPAQSHFPSNLFNGTTAGFSLSLSQNDFSRFI